MIKLKNKVEADSFDLTLEKDIFKYDGQVLVGVYKKENGQKVIQSWCDKDYDEEKKVEIYRYYSIDVSDKEIADYFDKKISLKALIQSKVFATFEDIYENDEVSKSSFYKVNVKDFPQEYMPRDDSLSPL